MMKKIGCILVLMLLLGIFVGCQEETMPSFGSTGETAGIHTTAAPSLPAEQQNNLLGLPMLSQERMALIENYGELQGLLGADWPQFRDVAPGKDSIRYYGSFILKDGAGNERTYDILYVPYPDIAVPTQINLRGAIFRSEYAFVLYAFSFRENPYEGIGRRYSSFQPLWEFVNPDPESGWQGIGDDVIAYALALHRQYEAVVEDNEPLSPPTGEEYERLRVQASWLLCTGSLSDFDNIDRTQRYYGRFQGMDVFYSARGMAGIPEGNKIIGNEVFAGTGYKLYIQKDSTFYTLENAYAIGLISDDTMTQIAQIHNQHE